MTYLVNVTARAERDLALLYEEINAENSDAALKWYRGLKEANLRHLLYGHKPHVYRVIYRLLAGRQEVDVLHIRHGARRMFRASDLA